MKRLVVVLAALCALCLTSSSQATTHNITLFRTWTVGSNTYSSGVIDTTNFQFVAGDTIYAVVPDRRSTQQYQGKITFKTTADSIIIPEGMVIMTNAQFRFNVPVRIGRPGGKKVKFIAEGLRSHPSSSGGTIDKRAGILPVRGMTAYNLEISGFTTEYYGAIKVPYATSITLCDSRSINNWTPFEVPYTDDNDLPEKNIIRISTIRHAFEDNAFSLAFDADSGVIYSDKGSNLGPAEIEIRFGNAKSWFNDAELTEYLARFSQYTVTFDGSVSDQPIDRRLVDWLIPLNGEEWVESWLNRIVRQRITIIQRAPNADFNGDGTVGFTDFFLFVEAFNRPAIGQWAQFNLNTDGIVDFADFFIFVESWGKTAASKKTVALANDDDLVRLLAIIRDRPELLPLVEYLLPRGEYGNFYSQLENRLPREFKLAQNFPNPFNPATTIAYSIPEPGDVKLVIYNLTGQVVRTLTEKPHQAGSYSLAWDATDDSGQRVASGLYIYQIIAGTRTETRRMLLIK